MRSRMDRYKNIDSDQTKSNRLNKNQELYQNIGTNKKYTTFTDVSKSNAYMINPSKKDNYTRENYQAMKEFTNITPQTRVKKELEDFNYLYQDHENRIYDINSVLEKAKENRKEKDALEEMRKLKNTNYNILASLNPEELEKYRQEKQKRLKPDENEIRDLIDTIASKTMAGEISKEASLDLLSDLMATNVSDKIETEKLQETNDKLELSKDILDKESLKKIEDAKKDSNFDKDTTSDIMKDIDKSFYTKSMDLSDKDFFNSDDEEKKIPLIIKIILVIILIVIIGVSVYFVYQSF